MNDISLKEIDAQIKALRFEKALALLDQISPASKNTFWYWIFKSRACRGLYKYNESWQMLEHAKPENSLQQAWLLCEMAKLKFSRGEIEEASQILENAVSDLSLPFLPEMPLALASIYAQEGKVKQALNELEPVVAFFSDPQTHAAPSYIEMCTLQGDLHTFANQNEEALKWYDKGLKAVDQAIAENWRPLRRALLYHNMADVYEQMEEYQSAWQLYDLAKKCMEQMDHDAVSDYSSYLMEINLSLANCMANADQYELAMDQMKICEEILEQDPPLQLPYFTARTHYFKGLLKLYLAQQDPAFHIEAVEELAIARSIQKKLVDQGLDKKEHLAKSSYYLAYSLDDHNLDKKELYEQAYKIFEEIYMKEPVFYLDSMAQIKNDTGRIMQEENPQLALREYREAISIYQKLLDEYARELFTFQSLLVTILNAYVLSVKLNFMQEADELADQIIKILQQLPDQKEHFEELLLHYLDLPLLAGRDHPLPAKLETCLLHDIN